MPYCEYCGEEIGYLPFKCKYCGGTYCKKHRLPENHECSFELKHTPVVPISDRQARSRYPDSRRKTYKTSDFERKRKKEVRKYLKEQRKERKRALRQFKTGFTGVGMANGTKYLMVLIIVCSVISFILSIFSLEYFINFSMFGILNLLLWTILTAQFVSASGIIGLLFLFILIIFFYNIAKNIELRFGTKFLITLYIYCALSTGIVYLFIRYLLSPLYPINQVVISIGLATGAILGLISFIVYFSPDREMMLFCYFVPVKMKGRTLLILLILSRVIPALLFGLIVGPVYLLLYLPDLGGILASYIIYAYKFRPRPRY
ncbi:MAG: hypothetical protein GF383_08355 [Candidatus Lokiarchaeota archaeon]|nr:hypothetical protein [Candidatus Lokiarchaeota archaeon]MBD3340365.1 hypothetical protein [Candidatus Lokiarchaeota archaeon]